MKRCALCTIKFLAIAILVCTLTACPPKNADPNDPPQDPPPQEDPPPDKPPEDPERYYISDYWPFAIGNHWYFLPDDMHAQYTYDVVEDYSTPDVSAWGLLLKTIDFKGIVIKEEMHYFVQMKTILVKTEDKTSMAKLIELAKEDDLRDVEDLFEVVAPAYFHSGNRPDDYWKENFTLTGPLADLIQYLVCPDIADPPKPDGFIPEADHHCMVDLVIAECKDGPVLYGMDFFARDIGPLVLGDWSLQYAYVDGVDYTWPED